MPDDNSFTCMYLIDPDLYHHILEKSASSNDQPLALPPPSANSQNANAVLIPESSTKSNEQSTLSKVMDDENHSSHGKGSNSSAQTLLKIPTQNELFTKPKQNRPHLKSYRKKSKNNPIKKKRARSPPVQPPNPPPDITMNDQDTVTEPSPVSIPRSPSQPSNNSNKSSVIEYVGKSTNKHDKNKFKQTGKLKKLAITFEPYKKSARPVLKKDIDSTSKSLPNEEDVEKIIPKTIKKSAIIPPPAIRKRKTIRDKTSSGMQSEQSIIKGRSQTKFKPDKKKKLYKYW